MYYLISNSFAVFMAFSVRSAHFHFKTQKERELLVSPESGIGEDHAKISVVTWNGTISRRLRPFDVMKVSDESLCFR